MTFGCAPQNSDLPRQTANGSRLISGRKCRSCWPVKCARRDMWIKQRSAGRTPPRRITARVPSHISDYFAYWPWKCGCEPSVSRKGIVRVVMSRNSITVIGIESIKQRLYREDKDPYWPRVRQLAHEAKDVLVFGAGRGASEPDLRGQGRQVCGLDVDRAVFENPYLDEALQYEGARFPYPDARFDLCCAYSVLEHLENPLTSFREIARVLRPSGRFVFRT